MSMLTPKDWKPVEKTQQEKNDEKAAKDALLILVKNTVLNYVAVKNRPCAYSEIYQSIKEDVRFKGKVTPMEVTEIMNGIESTWRAEEVAEKKAKEGK